MQRFLTEKLFHLLHVQFTMTKLSKEQNVCIISLKKCLKLKYKLVNFQYRNYSLGPAWHTSEIASLHCPGSVWACTQQPCQQTQLRRGHCSRKRHGGWYIPLSGPQALRCSGYRWSWPPFHNWHGVWGLGSTLYPLTLMHNLQTIGHMVMFYKQNDFSTIEDILFRLQGYMRALTG